MPNRVAVADGHFKGQTEGTAEAETKTGQVEAAHVRPDENAFSRRADHPNLYKERACAWCIADQDAGELWVRKLREAVAEVVSQS